MALKIDRGFIEGIDFSSEMVSIARKKNKGKIGRYNEDSGNTFDSSIFEIYAT